LAISITIKSGKREVYVSSYKKWYANERNVLFDLLNFNLLEQQIVDCYTETSIPKIANKISYSILNKFINKVEKITNCFEDSRNSVCFYYRRAFGAFVLFYDFIPKMFDEKDCKIIPTELKEIKVKKQFKDIILGLYYSNLFYFSTYAFSDCRNINKSEIDNFYIDLYNIEKKDMDRISGLSKELSQDLIKNSIMMDYNYKSGRRIFQAFFPRKSKPIIDEIDRVLAKHYGFTDEELDFIINYDIKYRMGGELVDDAGEEE
jgi:hypothetical protein